MFDFKKYLSTLNNEPQWFKDKRIRAWEKFSALPTPNENEEGWRLLDLDAVNLDNLQPVIASTARLSGIEDLKQFSTICEQTKELMNNAAGILVESPNGIWVKLDEQLKQKGVIITTLAEALTEHADLIKPYLDRLLTQNKELQSNELISGEFSQTSQYALLNQALCPSGMIVFVPKNVIIEKPFVCLHLLRHSTASLNCAGLLVVAAEHSQLSVVNVLTTDIANPHNSANLAKQESNGNGSKNNGQLSLTNFLLEVFLGPGAVLNYAEIQNFDHNTFAISHSFYSQERDSCLNSLVAALGGGQVKSEIRNILKDRGAESNLTGIVLGSNKERFNFNTIEDHIAPDTKSSIDFRVALKDEAQSIYHGNIQVSKTAQRTDAFQSNKNLLLGDEAHADSIPKLEILTDDVKCSHGATVGPVDRKQVFYLMSRGLDESQAEELIVNGFFHQLLADCSIAGIADWLDELVANKVHAGFKGSKIYAENKQPALTR